MATADQLKALVRSHIEGDDESFYSVALQVAASAARSGKSSLAQELRALVEERSRGLTRGRKPIPVAQPRGDLAGLLSVSYPDVSLADLVLDGPLENQLKRILLEQRQRDQLREHALAPARRILLLGPPGTGKTMSARMLATQLRLPLFTIRLDGLITKFLGETAAKLRLIFDAMAELRGAYLFDEVDALAGERSRANDVGEIRRVLNSFLQFLEEDESESLLIAASNHPTLLDRALFRRFDAVLNYLLPTSTITKALILKRAAGIPTGRLNWQLIQRAGRGLSHSDITLAVEQAAKDCILRGHSTLNTEDLLTALRNRRSHLRQA